MTVSWTPAARGSGRNGLFTPVTEFDWDALDDRGEMQKQKPVTWEHMKALFGGGLLPRNVAAARLMELPDVGRTTAYNALKPDGEFRSCLTVTDGNLSFSHPFDE